MLCSMSTVFFYISLFIVYMAGLFKSNDVKGFYLFSQHNTTLNNTASFWHLGMLLETYTF